MPLIGVTTPMGGSSTPGGGFKSKLLLFPLSFFGLQVGMDILLNSGPEGDLLPLSPRSLAPLSRLPPRRSSRRSLQKLLSKKTKELV